MRVHWRTFLFFSQIAENEQRNVPPCPRCFAKFILNDNEQLLVAEKIYFSVLGLSVYYFLTLRNDIC